MFSLLNRFAWIIAIMIGLQFSFFVDRDGPFDNEGFWTFLIVLLIIKFGFFSGNFIKSRLEFFANSIKENYIGKTNIQKIVNKVVLTPGKEIEEEKKEIPKITHKAAIVPKKKIEEVIEEPSKISLAISKFFSENLLAKLGGILVFLGVLFFLSLIYTAIGPVGKLVIGFAVGFSIFFTGVWLDKKDLGNEGRILLGIGILINYLVILSGRYLIGDNIDNNILTVGTTFLFLILNTVFAVVTSLLYKSRTLLLFSFLFAFINPLLVGGSSDNPYTLIGYSLIVALGGLYLANKDKDILLAIGIFILSNILFLIAPFSSDIHWIIKLIATSIISIITIFTVYKIDIKKLPTIFIGSYIFLILLLGSGDNYVKETTSFISYMISIVLFFALGIYYYLKTAFNSLIIILLSPILIILGLSFSGALLSIPLTLAIIILLYLVGFNFIKDKLPNFLKYIFFIILGIYIFLTNSFLSIGNVSLDLASFVTVIIVSFVFIFTSYYLSTKKDLEFLYSIGTIGGILTLAPILINLLPTTDVPGNNYLNQDFLKLLISIFSVIIFAISNWILPFINKNLIEKKGNIKNLIIGTIAGILFIGYQLFSFGDNYFPGVTLGFAFAILAVIYFIIAFMMMNIIGIDKIKKEESSKNTIYSYLAISISVFSLAIALIFSNYESIISSIWLFQATIMFYFYYKTKETKIYTAGVILFLIGIIKLFTLIDLVHSKDFIFLIPFTLIFISFVLNLKFLNIIKETGTRVFHDILHILGIGTLGILLLEIIPSSGHGWSILGITIFLTISSVIYSYFNAKILKIFFISGFTGFLLLQTGEFDSIIWRLENQDLNHLIILQYISTALLGGSIIIWNKINKQKSLNTFLNIVFALYLLIITSMYVYNIFNVTFAITIYWGIIASIMMFIGISKNLIKLRTIGLYLIALTAGKIFLYDIWYGLDDAISRVAALIILGVLFIIISTQYTKRYGNNITKEMSFDNLRGKKQPQPGIPSPYQEKEAAKNNNKINYQIKDIDVSNISSVQFIIGDEKITIRAVNLIKIVKMVTDKYQKTKFFKYELKEIYKDIKENYKSDLSKDNYNKIITIIERFIKEGGEVKLIEK